MLWNHRLPRHSQGQEQLPRHSQGQEQLRLTACRQQGYLHDGWTGQVDGQQQQQQQTTTALQGRQLDWQQLELALVPQGPPEVLKVPVLVQEAREAASDLEHSRLRKEKEQL
jgi:hypothetical protein